LIRLSVIIPAYNEEATIIEVLEEVRRQEIDGVEVEIVVINDCSTDHTAKLVEGRPELFDHFVSLPKNLGKGGAVQAGLRQASGDFILFQDADSEYDPSEYARLMFPVLQHSADVVMGSRFIAPEYTRVHYYWHKVGNRTLTFVFNIINNTTFSDIYSCYLLYRRDLINPEELRSFGWEQQAEILSTVVRRAKVIYEVPISYHGRTYDEGKKIRAFHTLAILSMIVRKGLRRSR
jgi:glycosyltransferase involved in cell wall biosynthesis